jgi:DNA-directed RNA polymerase specialized sigma24 family protein
MGGAIPGTVSFRVEASESRAMLESTSPLRFRTTRWSVVLAAGAGGENARRAFDALYRLYFRPLCSLIARQRGPEHARELAQAFFVSRLLSHGDLRLVERSPGRRFRSWLCTALQSYLKNHWKFERRKCRDVRQTLLLGSDTDEIISHASVSVARDPEQQLRRAEVLALLSQVIARLRREYCAHAGASGVDAERRFEMVKCYLPGPDAQTADYADCANALGLASGTVKQLVCKLRKRFGQLLYEEIRRSVDSEAEVAAARASLCRAIELSPSSGLEP